MHRHRTRQGHAGGARVRPPRQVRMLHPQRAAPVRPRRDTGRQVDHIPAGRTGLRGRERGRQHRVADARLVHRHRRPHRGERPRRGCLHRQHLRDRPAAGHHRPDPRLRIDGEAAFTWGGECLRVHRRAQRLPTGTVDDAAGVPANLRQLRGLLLGAGRQGRHHLPRQTRRLRGEHPRAAIRSDHGNSSGLASCAV